MRVVGGSAGGIPLFCPRSGSVRPTMDQVRGAIFSSLAERVVDANVLDLFAGVGGLGIEALSRGARTVAFVDRDRVAADCIRRNLEKTRLATNARIVTQDALSFLELPRGGMPSAAFDLVFADPPYTTREQPIDFAAQLLASAGMAKVLAAGGLFVLEKSPRHRLPLPLPGWEVVRQKQYGSSEVIFFQRAPAFGPDDDAPADP